MSGHPLVTLKHCPGCIFSRHAEERAEIHWSVSFTSSQCFYVPWVNYSGQMTSKSCSFLWPTCTMAHPALFLMQRQGQAVSYFKITLITPFLPNAFAKAQIVRCKLRPKQGRFFSIWTVLLTCFLPCPTCILLIMPVSVETSLLCTWSLALRVF